MLNFQAAPAAPPPNKSDPPNPQLGAATPELECKERRMGKRWIRNVGPGRLQISRHEFPSPCLGLLLGCRPALPSQGFWT
eukprot:8190055-Pyramimonas_sp.AAC.1